MAMIENGPKNERLWEQKESQEQLASQKFDEIFERIKNLDPQNHPDEWEKEHYQYFFKTGEGMEVFLNAIIDDMNNKTLNINKSVEYDRNGNLIKDTNYSVTKNKSHFYLDTSDLNPLTGSSHSNSTIVLSWWEFLSNVLPNFINRLSDANVYKQNQINKATEYAYKQGDDEQYRSWNEADALMDEFLAA